MFYIYLIRNHEHIANITYSPSIIYSLGPETKLGIPTLGQRDGDGEGSEMGTGEGQREVGGEGSEMGTGVREMWEGRAQRWGRGGVREMWEGRAQRWGGEDSDFL